MTFSTIVFCSFTAFTTCVTFLTNWFFSNLEKSLFTQTIFIPQFSILFIMTFFSFPFIITCFMTSFTGYTFVIFFEKSINTLTCFFISQLSMIFIWTRLTIISSHYTSLTFFTTFSWNFSFWIFFKSPWDRFTFMNISLFEFTWILYFSMRATCSSTLSFFWTNTSFTSNMTSQTISWNIIITL